MDYTFDITLKNRHLLNKLIDSHTPEQLNHIPDGFNNNIIWNIGHSIVTQQLLVYGLSRQEFRVPQEWVDNYKKGSKPTKFIDETEINAIKKSLFDSLENLKLDYTNGLFKNFKTYTLSTTGGILTNVEEALAFNNYHEGLHFGYSIALARAIKK